MKKILCTLFVLFCSSTAFAQNAGTVTNHAFAIGKGAGVTGYTSMLCTSAQIAVGQAAADPICQTITGDGTLSAAGVLAVTKTGGVVFGPLATVTPGAGVATWIATPSGANLATALTTGLPVSKGGTGGTAAGHVPGTATNDSGAAGEIGEFISSTVLVGSAVALTTGTAANITSVSLTAGDWTCTGNAAFQPNGATTISQLGGWISTTAAALPTAPNSGAEFFMNAPFTTGGAAFLPVGSIRFSLAGTTTVFLEALAGFGVNTMSAFGFIGCRRAR